MKIIFKFILLIIFCFHIFACQSPIIAGGLTVSGTWSNTMTNSDGSTVITTLDLNQNNDNFNATMALRLVGNESDTLKVPVRNIKFSGTIRGNVLSISDLDSDTEGLKTSSTFTLSRDGNLLTLSPGEIRFHKK